MPPWIPAAFDLAVLLLLAIVPLPVSGGLQYRQRWLWLASVYAVFGLLSLDTMVDYSTSRADFSLRDDRRLWGSALNVQSVRPTTEDLVSVVRSATALNLTVDDRLLLRQPDYGAWDLKEIQPWTVMEQVAARQTVSARWAKTEEGYILVPAAPFGKSRIFWFGSATFLLLSMLGLRWREIVQEREKALSEGIDRETKSVASLRAATCR